ncbi:EF-hand domain-containing protein [Candidatus Methylobacter oryzae]|uniref:EF-hand domain-containing protein n=1 Tax=Candidatus Methylobacter oryzae TaxID=2497749 RepID=A0ABY3CE74_9GAMM|nr:EF-hand domain-containing protein [Candidatus Methylobacter oryzae]TRX00881.1 EF-hand domain-containing protein [Candidatus Methylobacter oryzae]
MSMSISGMGGVYMPPKVMSGASSRMSSPTQKMSDLFQKIDTSGSGTISKAQFEQAFQNTNPPAAFKSMGADAIFSKLDPNGTGSVSKQDFVDGMKTMMGQIHHHHQATAGSNDRAAPPPAQTLASGLQSLNTLGGQPELGPSGTNINLSA